MSKRKIINKTLSFVLPSLIVGALSYKIDYNKKLETIAKVNHSIRNELYNEEILSYDNLRIDREKGYSKNEDRYITYEALNKLEKLEIDLNINDIIYDIGSWSNLKKLVINKAELLTDEEIEYLNTLNIEEIDLIFDIDSTLAIREKRLDLSKFKNKNIKIDIKLSDKFDELEGLIFVNYFENADKSKQFDDKFKEVIELDNKLDEIIKEINITDDMTDIEKIFYISDYVCNHLEYDKRVIEYDEEYYNNNSTGEYNCIISDQYNENPIKSILDQDKEIKDGVCINYASLFDIICYKFGVKSRLVTGNTYDPTPGHAWNIVYINDKGYSIDVTAYDDSLNEAYLSNYTHGNGDPDVTRISYDYLLHTMFYTLEYCSEFYDRIEVTDTEIQTNMLGKEDYFNENLDGEKVLNKDINIPLCAGLSLSSGLFGLSIEELCSEKKKKKELKLTSK